MGAIKTRFLRHDRETFDQSLLRAERWMNELCDAGARPRLLRLVICHSTDCYDWLSRVVDERIEAVTEMLEG